MVVPDSRAWLTIGRKALPAGDERGMVARFAILVAAFVTAGSALAEPLGGEAVRRLVAGKLFAYSCFDGSRGMGRVYADGSVIGTIQVQGSGPVRNVWLPAGTLHVKGDLICASLKGVSIRRPRRMTLPPPKGR